MSQERQQKAIRAAILAIELFWLGRLGSGIWADFPRSFEGFQAKDFSQESNRQLSVCSQFAALSMI